MSFTCFGVCSWVVGGLRTSDTGVSLTDEDEECLRIRLSSLAYKQNQPPSSSHDIYMYLLVTALMQSQHKQLFSSQSTHSSKGYL